MKNYSPVKNYAFIFVCQQGELEVMSLLLAASLKHYLNCNYELIAVVPEPVEKWGAPSRDTIDILERMDIRIEKIENNINLEKKGSVYTNKLHSLQIPTKMDKILFLDSDMFCMREFYGEPRFSIPFNAKPAHGHTVTNWEEIYDAVGLEVPSIRIMTTITKKWLPPYFNSGFIGINRNMAPSLSDVWMRCINKVYSSGVMGDNAVFIDQACLPLAVIKLGLDYDVLDERYNFPLPSRQLSSDLPFFSHYNNRNLRHVANDPYIKEIVSLLLGEYPKIKDIMTSYSKWNELFLQSKM